MFEQALVSSGPGAKRVWTTCLGMTGQTLLLACAVLAPILSPQILPRGLLVTPLLPPLPPPAPPKPYAADAPAHASGSQLRQVVHGILLAPRSIPARPVIIEDAPAEGPAYGVPGGIEGGPLGGIPGSVLSRVLDSLAGVVPAVRAPAPAAPAAAKPAPAKPLRVSVVEMARPIYRVEPQYPPLARQMRISGVVELAGVIGTDGRIHELKVVSGHPLLVRAAMDAVRQWIYAPTLLNGAPVEVIAPITVTFKLM